MPRTTTHSSGTRFAPLTEQDIASQTDSGSFSRGRTYFRGGRIHDTVLRGDTIEAQCDGSDSMPYRVHATLLPAGQKGTNPKDVSCTCPRGGFCKHIVALLLTWIEKPSAFAQRPALSEEIAAKGHEELAALVEQMILRYPDLESMLDIPMTVSKAGAANVPTVEAGAIRRQVQTSVASFDRWEWGSHRHIAGDINGTLQLGKRYADAGQWANAQVVFTNLAEEIMDILPDVYDEEGEFAGVVTDCSNGLAACLDAQATLPHAERLNEEQRERLITTLYEIWQRDIFEFGGFDLAQEGPEAIARNVTDDERAMVEEWLSQEKGGGWSGRALVEFRILLREHAGITDEEVLDLYREAELWDEVATLLLEMDRVGEAVSVARRYLQHATSLTSFASRLIARGGEDVKRGLTFVDDRLWEKEGEKPHEDVMLQEWLRQQYSAHGRAKEALEMAQRGFKRQPSLHAYHAVRDAARLPGQPEGTWDELRPGLLEQLRSRGDWLTLTQIHLEEGEVRAALDAYGKHTDGARRAVWYSHYADGTLEHQLARAAEAEYPDEAIAIYRQMAEGHIGLRSRPHYQLASGLLARMKTTLERHNRTDEWQEFIAERRAQHKTLRAFQDELNKAGL